jgi:hypothetical protein
MNAASALTINPSLSKITIELWTMPVIVSNQNILSMGSLMCNITLITPGLHIKVAEEVGQ